MQEYDPNILQKAVDDLYNEADGIVFVYTFLGVCIGALVVFLVVILVMKERSVGVGSMLSVVVSGLIAYGMGKRRSWELRFRAQQLRLQMQIEENTRRAAESLSIRTVA